MITVIFTQDFSRVDISLSYPSFFCSQVCRILKPVYCAHWKHDDTDEDGGGGFLLSRLQKPRWRNSLIFTRNAPWVEAVKEKEFGEEKKKRWERERGECWRDAGNRRPIKLSCHRASEAENYFFPFFFFIFEEAVYDIFHAR